MKEIIMKNKILCILILVMIAGVIVAATKGFKFDLMYEKNTRIDVFIGKDYAKSDIQAIVDEVFGKGKSEIQEIDRFKERVAITVPEASDEQVAAFKEKIVAKYELDASLENIQTTRVPHTRLRDMIKPYVVPVAIVTVMTLLYVAIRNAKSNPIKKVVILCVALICAATAYFALIAITRLPIGRYTMPAAMAIYAIILMGTMICFKKK